MSKRNLHMRTQPAGDAREHSHAQKERDAVREPHCDSLDELRVTYVALARRWRHYSTQQTRQR